MVLSDGNNMRCMVFCLFANLMKASFQRFPQCKNPLAGVFVFCLIVELAGVEPASRQGDRMLSTCLVPLVCRERPGAVQPNLSLVPYISLPDRDLPEVIPELRAPWNRVGTGNVRPQDVSSRHLVTGLSLDLLNFGQAARA